MKFHNALQLITLSMLKAKQVFFFHMSFSSEAVVSETMIVFVYYLLLASYHVSCILLKQWHREGENGRLSIPKSSTRH